MFESIFMQSQLNLHSEENMAEWYISILIHLNNVLFVTCKLANSSRSVRNRGNSIRKIHGPVRKPVSDIDGLRSRSRRGHLPRYRVSSSSCCHFCSGSEWKNETLLHPKSQELNSHQASHNNTTLSQPNVKVSSTRERQIDDCCKSMLRVLQGKCCRISTTHPTVYNLILSLKERLLRGLNVTCSVTSCVNCTLKVIFYHLNL